MIDSAYISISICRQIQIRRLPHLTRLEEAEIDFWNARNERHLSVGDSSCKCLISKHVLYIKLLFGKCNNHLYMIFNNVLDLFFVKSICS